MSDDFDLMLPGDDEEEPKLVSLSDEAELEPAEYLDPVVATKAGRPTAVSGLLPKLRELYDHFEGPSPAPSLHGLQEHQGQAAILQLCGCKDSFIEKLMGLRAGTISRWTSSTGWRSFQGDVLNQSLHRLAGIAHFIMVDTMLNSQDSKERFKVAKMVLDITGIHKSVRHHKVSVVHNMNTGGMVPAKIEEADLVDLPDEDDESGL